MSFGFPWGVSLIVFGVVCIHMSYTCQKLGCKSDITTLTGSLVI